MIVPAYSELYSLDKESSSENAKILSAIESVSKNLNDDKIWVDDRGGDRKKIIEPLLENDRKFIIRLLFSLINLTNCVSNLEKVNKMGDIQKK